MNIFICKYIRAIINLSYYTVQWLSNYDIAIISSYVWSFIIDFYAEISNWRITWLYESNNLFTHLHVQCTGLCESNMMLSHLHVYWTIGALHGCMSLTICSPTYVYNVQGCVSQTWCHPIYMYTEPLIDRSTRRITWLYESNNLFTHLHVQCTGLCESNILLSRWHVYWTINRFIAVTTCPIT